MLPAAAAHAAARVRDPPARLRRRRDGDREPQPAAGQRLQGLPRRRQPDRAARRRRDRRPDRRGRPARRRAPRRRPGKVARRGDRRRATSTPSPCSPATGRATSTSSTRRCTASAAPRSSQVLETGRLRRAARRRRSRSSPTRTSRPSPSPTPRSPGAMDLAMALAARARRRPGRRQRPRRRPLRRRGARRRTAGGCCAATRSARCSPTTCCASGQARHLRQLDRVLLACSGKIAAAAGQPYAETLTGFKWIGRVEGLAFGYEEALGYCVDPEHVRDKDGVSALLLLCELAAAAKAEGRTLADLLDDLAARARPARHRPALGPGRPTSREIADAMARLRGHAADRARRAARSSRSTTSRSGPRDAAARPTGCATGSPTAPG